MRGQETREEERREDDGRREERRGMRVEEDRMRDKVVEEWHEEEYVTQCEATYRAQYGVVQSDDTSCCQRERETTIHFDDFIELKRRS